MKTLIITVLIFSSSVFNNCFGKENINMNQILQEVIIFDNGILPIEKYQTEFVKVSFKLNENGKIEILEMNYSNETIKTQLIRKLSKIKLEEDFDIEEVYNYNFTFKKI
jgi:uncharacterized protein YrzB (UPF0473 family)